MSPTKPTIVLIPGAWHSPKHYKIFLTALQQAGYATISSSLPSITSTNPKSVTAATDSSFIHDSILLPLLEEGKEIILVCHSYGGLPGAAGAKGLSRVERSTAGERGGIIGLVIIAGLVCNEGVSLEAMMGGTIADWIEQDVESGTCTVPDPTPIFWDDAPPDEIASAKAALLPHALLSFRSPSPTPAWPDEVYDGRRGFIICMQDKSIPAVAQQMMLQSSGVNWDVKELQSSHSPFLSMPGKVNDIIVRWAEKWVGDINGM